MAARRLVVELTLGDDDVTKLIAITRSRTEPASRVERARMLLAYRDDPSFFAVGRALGGIIKPCSAVLSGQWRSVPWRRWARKGGDDHVRGQGIAG